jgi:hypothetical protein
MNTRTVVTRTAASSSRLYWESFKDFTTVKLDIPVGCTIFSGRCSAIVEAVGRAHLFEADLPE